MTLYETLQEIERQARSEYGRLGGFAEPYSMSPEERLEKIGELAFAAILEHDRKELTCAVTK